jgi:hypothetical protein
MNLHDISFLRIKNQQIFRSKFNSAKEIAGWMGALQAQDFNMSKWAFGIRIPGSTELMINKAIDSGEVIRTHLLRPTWHFASADDIRWILELTAPNIRAGMKFRDRELGLTDPVIHKSNALLEKSLGNGNHLTREELISRLKHAGIEVNNNRASHILVRAEIEGIICSGKSVGTRPTYALLDERVPKGRKLYTDEALSELARRYFTSHGPATLLDFTWWSGLPVISSKVALESIKADFKFEIIDNQTYWFSDSSVEFKPAQDEIFFLPAYDEFIISYLDRRASLDPEVNKEAVSSNGIFYPVIIINGKVAGTWKRTIKNDNVVLVANLFDSNLLPAEKDFSEALSSYTDFIGKKTGSVILEQ